MDSGDDELVIAGYACTQGLVERDGNHLSSMLNESHSLLKRGRTGHWSFTG